MKTNRTDFRKDGNERDHYQQNHNVQAKDKGSSVIVIGVIIIIVLALCVILL